MKYLYRPLTAFIIVSLISTAASAQTDNAVVQKFDDIAAAQAKAAFSHLPQFTLITAHASLPLRADAKIKMDVSGTVAGVTATIHDPQTGAPLESCTTPCKLSLRSGEDVLLVRYKTGYRWKAETTNSGVWNRMVKRAPYKTILFPFRGESSTRQIRCDDKVAASRKQNGDAKPCFRAPPLMPPKTITSGYCEVGFDVTPQGYLKNHRIITCSEPIFEDNSLDVLKYWRYYPKKIDGIAVEQSGLTERISYSLDNGRGKKL